MAVALRIFLLYSLCLFENGATSLTDSLKYRSLFGKCSRREGVLSLFNTSLQNCVFECNVRSGCKAVNYWRDRHKCVLLTQDEIDPIVTDAQQSCVFVRKTDIEQPSIQTGVCLSCNETSVCDTETDTCIIKECPKPNNDSGVITGNMQNTGSKVKVICDLDMSGQTIACLSNGSWSTQGLCQVAIDAVIGACENGWHRILESCYYIEQPPPEMNASTAVSYCHDRQAYLVQLETHQENDDVVAWTRNTVSNNPLAFWIGLADYDLDGTWAWIESSQNATFMGWSSGEPQNLGETNVVFWDAGWADISPTFVGYGIFPICEKSLSVGNETEPQTFESAEND